MTSAWKVSGGQAIAYGGQTYEPGETFTAPEEAVREAVARGLLLASVEKAKPARK